jgi:hypothetical protein
MWQPTEFAIQKQSFKLSHPVGAIFSGTELLAEGIRLSNAVELVCWDCEPVQLFICVQCQTIGCHSGDWASIRCTAAQLVILPALPEQEEDAWLYSQPPRFMWDKGALLLERVQIADLRRLVPGLPEVAAFKPLTAWEAIKLLFFEAPPDVLGKAWTYGTCKAVYKRESILATDYESDEEAVEALDRLLETGSNSVAPVELRPLSDAGRPVTFFFDRPRGFAEWRPLAFVEGQARLLLEPGYVIEWEGEDE